MPRVGATSARSADGPPRDAIPADRDPGRNTASTRPPRSSARASSSPTMTRLLETGQDPDALNGAVPADSPSLATKRRRPGPRRRPMPRGRFADRVVTIALLVYGLVNVVTSIPSMIDYRSYVTHRARPCSASTVSSRIRPPAGRGGSPLR